MTTCQRGNGPCSIRTREIKIFITNELHRIPVRARIDNSDIGTGERFYYGKLNEDIGLASIKCLLRGHAGDGVLGTLQGQNGQ